MAFNLQQFADQETLIAGLTLIAVTGTIVSIALPLLERDQLKGRMKSAALERAEIRARERSRLANEKKNAAVSLRNQPKADIKHFVEKYNLRERLSNQKTVEQLRKAGYRGTGPLYTFLFLRVALPLMFMLGSLLYLLVFLSEEVTPGMAILIALLCGGVGFYAPNIYVSNRIQKRQDSIRRAWPDTLDLMLICVDSGMSIEAAFRKVSEEIGIQSVDLAEELVLANAELSYLDDRRQAYQNLADRIGLDTVKNVVLALVQAEKYGTPLGQALRVLADENRLQRMQVAEKKAAELPPKLTVPMILFFLPVLMLVIIGPTVLQVIDTMKN
ncbi:type II secretion system F family protein [Flexibacterium corallicola]|uniref:type II secretion system F family protein n=1 Tax=Flexibacterium corallicola TaxID=3037259 RepID=UPI00286F3198|nr:type II secretion system F family protein [Pseudovibrio sp. M1P-2-3]